MLARTLRDSATIGVEQNRPMLTPGVQKVAWSEAIARSQLATSWQPGGGGQAVDLGDHRLADSRTIDCISAAQAAMVSAKKARPRSASARRARHFLEIVAGAEDLSRGRDHDDAHRRVVGGAGRAPPVSASISCKRQRVGRRVGERQPQRRPCRACRARPAHRRASIATISAMHPVSRVCAPSRRSLGARRAADQVARRRLTNSRGTVFARQNRRLSQARKGRRSMADRNAISSRC